MCKKLLFLFLILCSLNVYYSQIGFNTAEPDPKSVIDIVSTEKGILIPRMTEDERNAINPSDTQNGLAIYNTTEDCINYWSKAENSWNSICGKMGKAKLEVDCSNISVIGEYFNDVSLTSENKILLTVDVEKEGSYTISATSEFDNQYFFTKSGEFLSKGIYTIEIPAYGKPKNFTAENAPNDKFTIKVNGVDSLCTFEIKVENSAKKPDYRMTCASVLVKGVYQKDKALDPSHYIEVPIRFDATLHGAKLHIYTDKVDGISFDSGELTLDSDGVLSGMVTQTIILKGSGAPVDFFEKNMTISSNSTASSATCQAKVLVGYPEMKLYGIGTSTYNVNGNAQLAKLVGSEYNYGLLENSKVKFHGWSSRIDAGGNTSASKLDTDLLGENPPDIVVFGFDFTRGKAAGEVIKKYLDKGGVVLCYLEGLGSTGDFLQAIFGDQITAGYADVLGTAYKFSQNLTDPIINGPFGSLSEKYWGEDSSTTQGVSGLNSKDFVIYTTSSEGKVTAFRSRNYNFIFVGDGGFNSSNNNSTSTTAFPFWTDLINFTPIQRPSFGSKAIPVDNSTFTANAIAWAIERATNNGINPK